MAEPPRNVLNDDDVPEAAIELLIALGAVGVAQGGEAESLLVDLDLHEPRTIGSIQAWTEASESLSLAGLALLIKGLTLAEARRPGWRGGSVSPIIWTARTLYQRDPALGEEVATWVRERTRNPYAPFGSALGFRSFAQYYAYVDSAPQRAAAHEQRQAELRAAAARARENSARRRRLADQDRRSPARTQLIAELNALPTEECLRRLADDEERPVQWYPTRLAYAADQGVIAALDDAVRERLAARLTGKYRGPWATFRKRLTAAMKQE